MVGQFCEMTGRSLVWMQVAHRRVFLFRGRLGDRIKCGLCRAFPGHKARGYIDGAVEELSESIAVGEQVTSSRVHGPADQEARRCVLHCKGQLFH